MLAEGAGGVEPVVAADADGVLGACVPGAAEFGIAAFAGTWPANTELCLLPFVIVRKIEVIMKIAAQAEVNLVKKFAPPELPKTVWLEPPPPIIPMPPSLPDCTSTTRTRRMQVKT